jgi:hypothetical protein
MKDCPAPWRNIFCNPEVARKTYIPTTLKSWPTRGISICAKGSYTSDAPKPICKEKNWPAALNAE